MVIKFQLEVHNGKKETNKDIVYATLKTENGELLVNATLDYVVRRIEQICKLKNMA